MTDSSNSMVDWNQPGSMVGSQNSGRSWIEPKGVQKAWFTPLVHNISHYVMFVTSNFSWLSPYAYFCIFEGLKMFIAGRISD